MDLQQAYTPKDALRRGVEEQKFKRIVNYLIAQKNITRPEAEAIASEVINSTRNKYLELQNYFDRLAEKEIIERQKRRIYAANRKRAFNKAVSEIITRQKERELLEIQRRMRLEEQYRQRLIEKSKQGLRLQKDVIGTQIQRFKGQVQRFIEPIVRYGIVKAQMITGKPIVMLRNQRNSLVSIIRDFLNKKAYLMSAEQVRECRELIDTLTSLNMEVM